MPLSWGANCCIICNAPLTSSGKYTCSCFTVEATFQRSSCDTDISIDNKIGQDWDVEDPEPRSRKISAPASIESDREFLKNSDLQISHNFIPQNETKPPTSIETYSIAPTTDFKKITHSISDLSPKSKSISLLTKGLNSMISTSNVNSKTLDCFDVNADSHNNDTKSNNDTQFTPNCVRRSSLASIYSISPPISLYSNSIDSIDSVDIYGSSMPFFGGFCKASNIFLSSCEFENLAPTTSQPVTSIASKAKKPPFSLYRSKSIPESVSKSRITTKSKGKNNSTLFKKRSSMSNYESSINYSLERKQESPDLKHNTILETQTRADGNFDQLPKIFPPSVQSPIRGDATGLEQAITIPFEIEKDPKHGNSENREIEEQNERNYVNGDIGKSILKREKDFLCDTCQKEFGSKPKLRSHILTHSNAKPFRCLYNHCQKAFARHPDLRRHMRTIHTSIENEGSRRRKCEGWTAGILEKGIEPKIEYEKGTKWGCSDEFLRMDGLTKHWKGSKLGQLCIKQFQTIFEKKGTKLSVQQCLSLAKQNVLHSRKP